MDDRSTKTFIFVHIEFVSPRNFLPLQTLKIKVHRQLYNQHFLDATFEDAAFALHGDNVHYMLSKVNLSPTRLK